MIIVRYLLSEEEKKKKVKKWEMFKGIYILAIRLHLAFRLQLEIWLHSGFLGRLEISSFFLPLCFPKGIERGLQNAIMIHLRKG